MPAKSVARRPLVQRRRLKGFPGGGKVPPGEAWDQWTPHRVHVLPIGVLVARSGSSAIISSRGCSRTGCCKERTGCVRQRLARMPGRSCFSGSRKVRSFHVETQAIAGQVRWLWWSGLWWWPGRSAGCPGARGRLRPTSRALSPGWWWRASANRCRRRGHGQRRHASPGA
jgi:hypothetical protein